jgi:hypothetical protein
MNTITNNTVFNYSEYEDKRVREAIKNTPVNEKINNQILEDYIYSFIKSTEYDCIINLYRYGPLRDGDIPDNSVNFVSLELFYLGFVTKIIVKGQDGYNALTHKGKEIYDALLEKSKKSVEKLLKD